MKSTHTPRLVLALIALGLFHVSSSFAQNGDKLKRSERPIPNRYIVVLDDAAAPELRGQPSVLKEDKIGRIANELSSFYGGKVDKLYASALHGYAVEMSERQAQALSADERVKFVEEDFVVFAEDVQLHSPWGLDRIDQRNVAPDTYYNYLTTGAGVHAYVIDSGIRSTHLDFGGRVVSGADFVGDGQNGNDCAGHGTHVAGIIGGGKFGVAKQVTLHNVRVLGCDGRGTGSAILSAINWVTSNHISPSVANMSIGMDSPSASIENAITNSIATGVSYTLSAGNENVDACNHSPGGRVPNAVTVAATDMNESRADFSNFGPCVDIFAPGDSIQSAWILNDWSQSGRSGTSMAAPHVAGVMARLLQDNPNRTPAELKAAIIGSATTGTIVNANGSPSRMVYIEPGFTLPSRRIIINDDWVDPEPIQVTVSNLPGVISNAPGSVKLHFRGFSHSYPKDLSFYLVGPNGNSIALQGRAGGTAQTQNISYTISDTGAAHMPGTALVNGTTYKPTVNEQTLPSSANNPGPAGGGTATMAATFGDMNPNGIWRLVVRDLFQHSGDTGIIEDWSLEIDTVPAALDDNPPPPVGGALGFLGYDSATKGNWIGKYGSLAFQLEPNDPRTAQWVSVAMPSLSLRSYFPPAADDRGLDYSLISTYEPRRLTVWSSPTSFDIPIVVSDNRTYRLAMYFVDYGGLGRRQTVDLINTETGALIDRRLLQNFNGGKWLAWQIRGRVTVRVTNDGGTSPNAVFSGYFIDRMPDSSIPPPSDNSVARFVGFDTATQGNWVGTYGSEGKMIALDTPQELPSWAGFRQYGGAVLSTIQASFTTDRSLQKASDPGQRITSAYEASTREFGLTFDFTDGKTHRLALYNYDFGGNLWNSLDQFYEIVDENGTIIDRRRLHNISNGIYAVWEVKGKFTIWVKNLDGTWSDPPMINGIFIDPPGAIPNPAPAGRVNVALGSNAARATSSSESARYDYDLKWAINGNRAAGSTCERFCWSDSTVNTFPDWFQVEFNGPQTIDEIDVITTPGNEGHREPTEQTTFTQAGITAYDVQYWDGSVWVTVPNGSVINNDKVWRKFLFSPIVTTKIRVVVNSALNSYSRIAELEAWSITAAPPPTPSPTPTPTPTPAPTPGGRTNFALAANGGVAAVSSQYSDAYPAAALNNGDRKGLNWESGGGWNDSTASSYPDWVEVAFGGGSKTIDEIGVFTIQDAYAAPQEPTEGMTFSQYGVTDFDVEYWNGSAWIPVPDGSVTGNRSVWRRVTFAPVQTAKIRVLVTGSLAGYSRLVEIEAWGGGVSSTPTPTPVPTPTPTPEPTPTPVPTPAPGGERTNYALASNGSVIAVSSQHSPGYPAESLNNGDRKGIGWAAGGGWNDADANTYPDWAEVSFESIELIDEIDVFTLQDNFDSPADPTPDMTFGSYGAVSFDVQYWTGSGWQTVLNGSVTGNNKVWNRFNFAPVATQKIRVSVSGALAGFTRLVELEAWGGVSVTPTPTPEPTPTPTPISTPTPTPEPTPTPTPTPSERANVALASNGGTANASSQYSGGYPAGSLNDGDRTGANWGSGGGWNDATEGNHPDWAEIAFGGVKTIDRIGVFTVQDAYWSPAEPTAGMTFSQYGITAFDVQYWNGADWVTVPEGSVTGNNNVWREIAFPAVATTKIRVLVHAALAGYSRVTEIEAWTGAQTPTPTPGVRTNYALVANGAVASASSTYNGNYPVEATNDGDRRGINWAAGGGWNDADAGVFPDWLQVDFNGTKLIDRVGVFTVQDAYSAPQEPDETMVFYSYGITDFEVQYWTGSAWAAVPGGTVTGNNKVWREVTFPAVQTSKIRVVVHDSLGGFSRIVEVEAWGT